MLPDFRLETYFSKWEFKARYNLCASDMESIGIAELVSYANADDRRAWDELRLGYTETWGAPALREAISTTYDNVDASDVLTFAGAEEGIFAAMQVLLAPDDHAIVVTPNYQAAETVPGSICEISGVPLDPNRGWALDLNLVENALRPNTKVISINFPHNPTGKVIDADTLESLVSLARERGIHVFSDEVYRLLERDDSLRIPQVADIYERGLSLNVMSKAYGLPGLRIGWIATRDRSLLERMERAKHYLSICNSAPSELLSIIALKARHGILHRNRGIIKDNLEMLAEFFQDYPDLFEWKIPDGGCIGYPRYLGNDGVESFCSDLVENAGVLLLPASIFQSTLNDTPGDRFRIGYGRLDTEQGVAALRKHLTAR
jgi:aspartate/methionine/tyrosine aminotransferase